LGGTVLVRALLRQAPVTTVVVVSAGILAAGGFLFGSESEVLAAAVNVPFVAGERVTPRRRRSRR
jgi:hypothetical protein